MKEWRQETRTCPACKEPFIPHRREQASCGKRGCVTIVSRSKLGRKPEMRRKPTKRSEFGQHCERCDIRCTRRHKKGGQMVCSDCADVMDMAS